MCLATGPFPSPVTPWQGWQRRMEHLPAPNQIGRIELLIFQHFRGGRGAAARIQLFNDFGLQTLPER